MRRKTYFNILCYTNEYYIAGVNVLQESVHRKYIKEVDLSLSGYSKKFLYKYVNKAKLYIYKINGKKFKLAIAQMAKDVYLIAYLTAFNFVRCIAIDNEESRQKNIALIYAFALSHTKSEKEGNKYIYSKDRKKRVEITTQNEGVIAINYQSFEFNPDADIDFPDDIINNPYEHLGWYVDNGANSIVDDEQTAEKEIANYLQ